MKWNQDSFILFTIIFYIEKIHKHTVYRGRGKIFCIGRIFPYLFLFILFTTIYKQIKLFYAGSRYHEKSLGTAGNLIDQSKM